MNESDAEFVKKVVAGQLQVSDITKNIKVNVPANGKRKGKKVPSLVEYFRARMAADPEALQKEGIQAAHVDHTLPPSITNFIDSLMSRGRAERPGGAFDSITPTDPKAQLEAARRRADEKCLQRETVELELKGLRHEERVCLNVREGKDAEAAGTADATLKVLRERRIPDVHCAS